MKGRVVSLVVLGVVFWAFVVGESYGADPQAQLGKTVYERRCAFCHGLSGNGHGTAEFVYKKKEGKIWKLYPRDFTFGSFKFRSTPTGSLPTDADLMRILTRGIPRSSMPAGRDLSDAEKTLSSSISRHFLQDGKMNSQESLSMFQLSLTTWEAPSL